MAIVKQAMDDSGDATKVVAPDQFRKARLKILQLVEIKLRAMFDNPGR